MEELKSYEWSWKPFASDVEHQQSYSVDIEKSLEQKPFDALQNNLFHINPVLFARSLRENENRKRNIVGGGLSSSNVHQFIDPRTKSPSKDHICIHEDIDLAEQNELLKKTVMPSQLSAETQLICLRYLTSNKKCENDKRVYDETKEIRASERGKFTNFVRNVLIKSGYRNDFIRPAIGSFIEQKIKREILEMLETADSKRYRLISAFNLKNDTQLAVNVSFLSHERVGKIPKLKENIKFLWQSTENIFKEYKRQRNNLKLFETKILQTADDNQINVIIPLSAIRKFMKNSISGYLMRVNVKETSYGKRIELAKPLPRHKALDQRRKVLMGSKYVLRASVCSSGESHFDCTANEILTESKPNEDQMEISGTTSEYKLNQIDDSSDENSENVERNISLSIIELTCSHRCIRILVPSKQDAFREGKDGATEFVNLSSKVESKAEYGAEQMSQNELIYEWCGQYFRSNTVTERYRHDLVTGKLVKCETIALSSIESNLNDRYKIQPELLIRKFWSALNVAYDFPVGEYLLVNNPVKGGSLQIKIYQSHPSEQNTISINSFYESSSEPATESHWCTLDDSVVLDVHGVHQMLPCAFPPTEYYESNNMKPPEHEIRPQTDSNRYSKHVQKRRESTNVISKNRRARKNAQKRTKRNEKKKEKEKEMIIAETNKKELESIQSLFDATPGPSTKETIAPTRTLRKRTHSATNPTKSVNIAKAQEEIRRRQITNEVKVTRSGRIVKKAK